MRLTEVVGRVVERAGLQADVQDLSLVEARQHGLKGRSAMNKVQLEAALTPSRGTPEGKPS